MGTTEGVTIGEACTQLGITRKTLAKWMRREQIEPTRHDRDWRFYTLTVEQVEVIRAARAEMPALAVTARPRAALPITYDLGHGKTAGDLLGAPQRHIAQNRPYIPPADRQALPIGWISFNQWCEIHGVNHRAVQREIERGRMSAPARGQWWERPQGPTLSAYDGEAHRAASRFAAVRWPARFNTCPECLG